VQKGEREEEWRRIIGGEKLRNIEKKKELMKEKRRNIRKGNKE
jgi:hypothetical protein